jgi:hypothetical protein
MSIVNDKLLADNLKRINDLHKAGLSYETIASASRDRTGDSSISQEEISSFHKIGNIANKQMLIKAKPSKKLIQFAQAADGVAASVVADAKETSKQVNQENTDA